MSRKKIKIKRNKSFKQKLLVRASGGILAGMMLVGANSSFAQVSQDYSSQTYNQKNIWTKTRGMHIMHRFNSLPKASTLASKLGLDAAFVAEELKSGKPLKQILQENGITLDEVRQAYVK